MLFSKAKGLLLAAALSSTSAAPAGTQITSLPGLANMPSFSMYSGYVTVDQAAGRKNFYWLVESGVNPSTDPLVVWWVICHRVDASPTRSRVLQLRSRPTISTAFRRRFTIAQVHGRPGLLFIVCTVDRAWSISPKHHGSNAIVRESVQLEFGWRQHAVHRATERGWLLVGCRRQLHHR